MVTSQARTTTSKVTKLLGVTNLSDSKSMDVEKIKLQQKFIVVYYFYGTRARAGVGHVALWDGERYFSYGKGDDKEKFEGFSAPNEESASRFADSDIEDNGHYRKITLLVDDKFLQKRPLVQESIQKRWFKSQYKALTHNCVHMVYDYLVTAGILPVSKWSVKPTCPFRLKDKVRKIGETQLTQYVQEEMRKKLSPEEMANRRHFLRLLQADLLEGVHVLKRLPRGIRELKALLIEDADLNLSTMEDDAMLELYYKVKSNLVHKNYDKVYSRSVENQAFYNHWLTRALDPVSYHFAAPKKSHVVKEELDVDQSPRLRA